jgi:hypothetical protein
LRIEYVLIPLLLAGCGPKEDPIQTEYEAVKDVLQTDVRNFLGGAIDGKLIDGQLYHHGTEGQFGVDYTLCGGVRIGDRPIADHTSDNLFIITMRLGNNGRVLGESDIQLADASPNAMSHRDALVNMLCSNSASPLPAKYEPPDNR